MQAQAKLWNEHLSLQYRDRVGYWNMRAASRLGTDASGRKVITLICDSMDRSKWSVPRSAVLEAKELAGLQRPNLDLTRIIVHGQCVAAFFAEPSITKGASWTIELLAHVFHVLTQQGYDLRSYECSLHGDNCSKEIKSNSVAKFLALMVARSRLRKAHIQTLMTGHSHEDIDQMFSLMGSYLATQRELHDPSEFREAVVRFFANNSVRPAERLRLVERVSQVRDWNRGVASVNVFWQTVCIWAS